MDKINIKDKFQKVSEYWSPKIIAELNGQHVKLAKIKGEFDWHKHDEEDEMFIVVEGSFIMEFEDKKVVLKEGECIVVPKGVLHRPVAENEAKIMLFEPKGTLNTGDIVSEKTRLEIPKI